MIDNIDDALGVDDLTPIEARIEIERHGKVWWDFTQEHGEKEAYTGEEVLGWLGY